MRNRKHRRVAQPHRVISTWMRWCKLRTRQALQRPRGRARHQPLDPARELLRRTRTQRRRQDYNAAHAPRPITAQRRTGHGLRATDSRTDARRAPARRRRPQADNLDPDFTVAENLRIYGSYFGLRTPGPWTRSSANCLISSSSPTARTRPSTHSPAA